MGIRAYRQVWAIPIVRATLLVGVLARVPNFAMGVVLILHIVSHLDPRYSAAGLVTGVWTVAAAISGPWRGHLLDSRGLRRTMLSSLFIVPVGWTLVSFAPYWGLLVLAVPIGVYGFPIFSVVRQVMVASVPLELRRTAMSLDSVLVEVTYMVGPTLGVLAATQWSTRGTLIVCTVLYSLGGLIFTLLDPPITSAEPEPEPTGPGTGRWISLPALAILIAVLAAGFVLGGTDLSIVAALRSMAHPGSIGWELALWGLGSAIGGLVFGSLRRNVPVVWLVLLLALTTMPLALAQGRLWLGLLLILTGLFCAPTLAASATSLSTLVRAQSLGEVMGWHGSAVTAGSALSPIVIGAVIDGRGWRSGFLITGLLGAVGGGVLLLGMALRGRREGAQPASEGE